MPTKNSPFAPRKEPVQARSRMTVKAILEATAQVLVANGYERAGTDAIAALAGVSIGTLYQYFPNKESLVATLIRNHVDEVIHMIEAVLNENQNTLPETALAAMILASVEAHRINPPLHKVLFEQVPRKQILAEALDVGGKLQAMIESFLRKKSPNISRARARMIALVIETTIEALTHRAIIETPDWLRTGQLEHEANKLLRPYLLSSLQGIEEIPESDERLD